VENSEKIIKWSIDNRNILDLEVIYYTGLKDFLPKVEDIGINIKINNYSFHGRGTDTNEEVAYLKAFSECIERATTYFLDIPTTNGIASHFDLDSAKTNAQNELIERDSFLCNFLLSSKFNKIHTKTFYRQSSNININIDYYEISKCSLGVGVLAMMNSSFDFLSFGLAFSKTLDKAEERSTFELLRDFVHFENNQNLKLISIEEFNNSKDYNLNIHGDVSKTKKYLHLFRDLITKDDSPIINLNYDDNSFSYQDISNHEIFPNCPLYVVKATNPKLQNLYFGPTTHEKVNLVRLSDVAGKIIDLNDINLLPHPID
jgi:hypothetical protein